MGKVANLSHEKRAQIVALAATGLSQQRIAHQISCSQSSVSKAIQRFRESGSNVDRPRSGAPRVSTARDDAYLCHRARRLRHVTARALQAEWQPAVGRRVSIQTIRNRSDLQ